MELIPILSTIILVATISTFILAIGAYILYKIRERKAKPVAEPGPYSITGELITPVSEEQQYEEYPEGKELKIPGKYTATKQTIRKPVAFTNAEKSKIQFGAIPSANQDKNSADYYKSKLNRKQEKFIPFTPEEQTAVDLQKPKNTIKWR